MSFMPTCRLYLTPTVSPLFPVACLTDPLAVHGDDVHLGPPAVMCLCSWLVVAPS